MTDPPSLIVYSTGPACMRCTLTCRCADKFGLKYVVVDLRENLAAREYVTDDLGYSEAPVVVVNGDYQHHWSGFRPDLIEQLARRHV
ncbi:glutaredoxin family protein [Microbacterium sp.]|uniref:glutaredoxin family protein n=1 Tax=Microbacterium sp. TaxID=51671 RepID=UPI003F719AF0